MALPIGKLTILVGAGIVGSVLAKEGRIPDVSSLVSGAFKIFLKENGSNESASAVKKPPNDALMAQVSSLRQELQLLARDRTITIVNASGSVSGAGKYGTVIIIVVVGYGYIWWKGWKLPDLMFATRRSLSDASTSIGNQLGKVYESIEEAKKKLSARINRLDSSLDECAALTENTRVEISEIQRETDTICGDFSHVRVAVRVLESKIKEIEGKQASTTDRVTELCQFAMKLENGKPTERIQASSSSSSRPALDLPPVSPSSRDHVLQQTGSLPPNLSTDPISPSYSAGRCQESNGISDAINSPSSAAGSNGILPKEDKAPVGSGYGLLGRFLTRTRSATDSASQFTRSNA
ncbi:uncharacterized protein LOC114729178 isoform X3 [Neltuma alba]|uniref:uncharacterized protein LOC114729178 isoform X3 n=1 Tax=Neltuma alba TaxID=207710 RepID=UPI0010A3F8BC|nr:uncharacterized protein LOC114729178 isoform X3 [Prosopis alba]